uniref:Uncharacterized protein n=1 Tax=viral metagenome TaxID=1070528 RepID=A0A6M3KTA3_9ZZZZ
MEAKDTVMNILEIDNITGDEAPCSNCPTPDGDCNDCYLKRIAEAQAKITWEKATEFLDLTSETQYKAGIKEAMDWVRTNIESSETWDEADYCSIDIEDWQAKLKEWGLSPSGVEEKR